MLDGRRRGIFLWAKMGRGPGRVFFTEEKNIVDRQVP